jgi:hypothetical protein
MTVLGSNAAYRALSADRLTRLPASVNAADAVSAALTKKQAIPRRQAPPLLSYRRRKENRGVIMLDKRRVEYRHNKAEEARVIAQTMANATNRQTMLSIADDFERLAWLALDGESLTQRIIDQETADLRNRSEIVDMLMKT